MDSMRHLSTSLPTTSRRGRHAAQQPQQLLSDFKAAALSVTNLYKTAAAENTRAREQGYQDALDDVLAFLDKENMGLMDGEGWRVRRWATERLDDAPRGSDEEEETVAETAEGTRSSSPEVQRKPPMPAASSDLPEDSVQRRASEPPQQEMQPPAPPAVPSLEDFSFRSHQAYPTNHDREDGGNGMELDNQTSTTAAAPSTVRITPKPPRSKHANHARNRENRTTSATFNFNLGSGGAGSKRKIPYPDFFDISGMNPEGQNRDRKDGDGRGGKRGRHV